LERARLDVEPGHDRGPRDEPALGGGSVVESQEPAACGRGAALGPAAGSLRRDARRALEQLQQPVLPHELLDRRHVGGWTLLGSTAWTRQETSFYGMLAHPSQAVVFVQSTVAAVNSTTSSILTYAVNPSGPPTLSSTTVLPAGEQVRDVALSPL